MKINITQCIVGAFGMLAVLGSVYITHSAVCLYAILFVALAVLFAD